MRYAEFCAGVGGFRLGIEKSGLNWKLVYTNEIDDSCERTYEKNFKQPFDSKDIFGINPNALPDFEVLCAGFPCQPFSVAGKELGYKIVGVLPDADGIGKPDIWMAKRIRKA